MATTTVRPPETVKTGRSLYRLSVEQYHAMMDAGIFKSGDKIELLEGILVEKMTVHPPHATSITAIQEEFPSRLPEGWIMRMQMPITTTDSEPEPDCVVVPGPRRRYVQRHPVPNEVALVVEVSDSFARRGSEPEKADLCPSPHSALLDREHPQSTNRSLHSATAGRNPTYRHAGTICLERKSLIIIAGQEVGSISVEELFT